LRRERIMQKWTQTYFDQGKAEGRTEGRTEGEAKMLVRVIEKRFGVVPPQLRQRIFSADVATLEAWAERLLDSPDLQSVFESN
jgi:flagellar biosynthesis/type III secretory pathway protein FliH